jgi:hypothetical protein
LIDLCSVGSQPIDEYRLSHYGLIHHAALCVFCIDMAPNFGGETPLERTRYVSFSYFIWHKFQYQVAPTRAKAAEYAPLLYICESKGTEERPY